MPGFVYITMWRFKLLTCLCTISGVLIYSLLVKVRQFFVGACI